MKKTLVSILVLTMIFVGFSATAGKPFKGKIIYKMNYDNADLPEEALAQMPKIVKMLVRDGDTKTIINTPMGKMETINYGADNMSYTLLNLMGTKYAIKQTEEEVKEEMGSKANISIEYTDETKEVAGYTCKKAIISYDEDEEAKSTEVWYTEEIDNSAINGSNPLFKDLKGVALEFEQDMRGMKVMMTASTVEKENISKKEFEIPEEYKVVTRQELRELMGGGM